MSVERAIEIADLFNIPLSELLCEPTPISPSEPGRSVTSVGIPERASIVIDLRRAQSANLEEGDATRAFSLFLAWIVGLRQDWNGEVLSLRKSDVDILALLMFKNPDAVMIWLEKYHLLISA